MAEVKKTYSKKEEARLDLLKKEAVAVAKTEKEKVKKSEDLKKKKTTGTTETSGSTGTSEADELSTSIFGESPRPDKAIAVLSDLIKDPRKDPREFTIEELRDLGIYKDPKNITIQEVVETLKTREVLPATKPVYFKLNYVIEPIPRPDVHKIYGLNAVSRKAWDKQFWMIDPDDGKYKVMHKLKNFVKQTGEIINVSVSGAPETRFSLVIHNETDNTYFDWDAVNPDREQQSDPGFKTGFRSITTIIPSNEGEVAINSPADIKHSPIGRKIGFEIPPSSTEKVYKISFLEDVEHTTYNDSLPIYGNIEKPGYKITQLPNPTTTIKFSQEDRFISAAGDLEITHLPGSRLSANVNTEGKYTISLSITSKRVLSLNTGLQGNKLTDSHVEGYSGEYTSVEIEGVDLTASITDNIGSVTGTITIGKTGLRSSEVLINPSSIFSLD